jgi:hypothetical protein
MKQILFLASYSIISLCCFPQAGFLDETFGNQGLVYTDLIGHCYAIAIQSDNKIVAGGLSNKNSSYIIIRYLPNGDID